MKITSSLIFLLMLSSSTSGLQAQAMDSVTVTTFTTDTANADNNITDSIQPLVESTSSINKPTNYFQLLSLTVKDGARRPFHLKSKEWTQIGLFSVALGTTLLLDRPINEEMQRLRAKSGAIRNSSPVITQLGGFTGLAVVGGFGIYGLIAKDQKMKTTVLLASQSFLIAGVSTAGLKMITGRTRPDFFNRWKGPDYYFKTNASINGYCPEYNSFPSGHTSTAFSIATIFAKQYSNKKWVPAVSYGLASMVGVTRVIENRHWASDVLAGAALGYLCGNLVMANYKRMNKKKSAKNLL